jgi:hypothetical protein
MFQKFIGIGKLRIFPSEYIPTANPVVQELYSRLDGTIRANSNLCGIKLLGLGYEIPVVSERLFQAISFLVQSSLNRTCYSFTSYDRLKFHGRSFSTAKYCDGLKRNNSLVQLVSGEIFRIEYILEASKSCICDDTGSKSLACSMPIRQLFSDGIIFFVGSKVNVSRQSTNSFSVVNETFINGSNVIDFIYKVDSKSRSITRAFYPANIKNKVISIPGGNKVDEYCVVNKIRFEMD